MKDITERLDHLITIGVDNESAEIVRAAIAEVERLRLRVAELEKALKLEQLMDGAAEETHDKFREAVAAYAKLREASRHPNEVSREAVAELEAGNGQAFNNIDDLMADLTKRR